MKRVASEKVSRATTYRRGRADKLAMPPASAPEAAQTWGAWVRGRYELSRNEVELVKLAEVALGIANDEGARAEARLAASARFASLLRQLGLEAAHHG